MIPSKFRSLATGALAALSLCLFTGCGGDSSSSATGPSGAASFAGTSMTFNPTVNFLTASTLTYFNDEVGSPFPAADPAINGTFTYVPNANFTGGVLTLTLDGVIDPLVLDISDFRRSGANVTGFTARSGGQSYPVDVTGTLPAYQRPSGGGSGGSGETSATDIPASVQGVHSLTFDEFNSGSGISDGTVTEFTIGARTLAFGGKTLTDPVFINGGSEWIFKDGNLWYAVSQTNGGTLNEINVGGPNGTPFYGQYNDHPAPTVVEVDQDGKFVPGTAFSGSITTENQSVSGVAFDDVPELGDPTAFTVDGDGALVFSMDVGGSPQLHTLPFLSSTATTVTYRFQEIGTPSRVYDVVVNKNRNSHVPSTMSATLSHSQSGRTTTNYYTLSVTVD